MIQGPTQPRRGAGAIIALLTITGAIAGGLAGQPSIGLLAGLGGGIAIAVILWLVEARR